MRRKMKNEETPDPLIKPGPFNSLLFAPKLTLLFSRHSNPLHPLPPLVRRRWHLISNQVLLHLATPRRLPRDIQIAQPRSFVPDPQDSRGILGWDLV